MTSSLPVGPDATTDPDTAALRGRAAAGTALALALAQRGGTAVQDWATGSALPAVTAAATTVADRASGVATDTVLPALTVAAAHARDAVLESGPAHQVAARAALVAAGAGSGAAGGRCSRSAWLPALHSVRPQRLVGAGPRRRRPRGPTQARSCPLAAPRSPPVTPGPPATSAAAPTVCPPWPTPCPMAALVRRAAPRSPGRRHPAVRSPSCPPRPRLAWTASSTPDPLCRRVADGDESQTSMSSRVNDAGTFESTEVSWHTALRVAGVVASREATLACHPRFSGWSRGDSNPQPPPAKADVDSIVSLHLCSSEPCSRCQRASWRRRVPSTCPKSRTLPVPHGPSASRS